MFSEVQGVPNRAEKVNPVLGGRFEYFLFFSARGRGRGSPRRQEGAGVGFLLEIPGGGGGEGPGGCLRGILGGDLKYFFSGLKCLPRVKIRLNPVKSHTRRTPFADNCAVTATDFNCL